MRIEAHVSSGKRLRKVATLWHSTDLPVELQSTLRNSHIVHRISRLLSYDCCQCLVEKYVHFSSGRLLSEESSEHIKGRYRMGAAAKKPYIFWEQLA